MQQEDDLGVLQKTMDFMRALSILFVVINIYWFCYGQIREWGINIGVVDRILLNFDRTAGLFRNILWTKTFRRRVPRPFMPRDKRSKRGENYLAENHGIAGHGRRAVLLQLVAAGLAADGDGERGFLHTDPIGRVYLPLDGRRVDVPPAEEQSHG